MQADIYGWALLLSDSDHRPQTVAQKLAKLRTLKFSADIVDTIGPVQLVFGHQPYHIILKLRANSENDLLQAFKDLEASFSHVDGFI